MRPSPGRIIALSLARRFVGDLIHFARKVPSVPVERRMNLAVVRAARQVAHPRPRWCSIFTKAYALVAANRPPLRRAYLAFPTPHLYEHPDNIAAIGVERQWRGEDAVFFGDIRRPEHHSLLDLDAYLRRWQQEPVEAIGTFRRALKTSRWPRPLRRALWWWGLNGSGPKRARQFGTFGVSAYSGLGASSLHPLSPLTTALNYGVIAEDGSVEVRIIYDHRVLDGATVARALAELESVLNHQILNEIRHLAADAA